jgi:uncharacterized membrane protein YfcA
MTLSPSSKRTPYSTASLWFAALLGGLCAVAWMARQNRLRSSSPRLGVSLEIGLWIAAFVGLLISLLVPSDILSQLILIVPYSVAVLGMWLLLSKSNEAASTSEHNRAGAWTVLAVILVARYAQMGFMWHSQNVASVARDAYAAWVLQHRQT